jgi:hypothetical protein
MGGGKTQGNIPKKVREKDDNRPSGNIVLWLPAYCIAVAGN